MKKTFIAFGIALLIVLSCSKSGKEEVQPASDTEVSKASPSQNFTLNTLKLDASIAREWVSSPGLQTVLFTFFSKDLTGINSNLTLAAYAYEKKAADAVPVILDINSASTIQLKANTIFSNNHISIDKLRKMITNSSALIEFDYLLFEPGYYMMNSNVYISYNIIAYKNGEPVSNPDGLVSDGGDGGTNPSPPAPPPFP